MRYRTFETRAGKVRVDDFLMASHYNGHGGGVMLLVTEIEEVTRIGQIRLLTFHGVYGSNRTPRTFGPIADYESIWVERTYA
jgi:hypothetical protein